MTIVKRVLMGILIVSISNCATMFNGTTQQVNISSIPPGATVQLDGITATTPSSVSLKRGKSYVVKAEKDGCQPAETKIERRFSMKTLLDLVWLPYGTIIFGIIDFASGGAWYLDPENVNVALQCEK
jgi:hypothetical protein